jgi:serine-type D-Ala-D-Ala carboxypeptidase
MNPKLDSTLETPSSPSTPQMAAAQTEPEIASTLRSGTPEKVGMSAPRVRQIARLAESWVEQGVTPALVVLAARRGVVVLHEAFGRLTSEPDSPPLALDSLFPLASLGKVITATAAMILVEEGRLGLNRPVQEYIPEFVGEGKDAVMVHHLMTHTAGLNDDELVAYAEQRKGSIEIPPPLPTTHPLVHADLFSIYDAPLWKPPGTEMSYSSYGYEILGDIIGRVASQPLADFARDRIFTPLGMVNTDYIVPPALWPRVVKRPANAVAAGLDTEESLETPWGSGGQYSTAMDMAIFGQMFLNGGRYGDVQVLSPATVAEMTRNQIPGIKATILGEVFPEAAWGYGWSIHGNKRGSCGALYSPAAYEHWGAGGVYMWVDPTYEIVGVTFSVDPIPASEAPGLRWGTNDLFTDAVTAAIVDA